MGFLLLEGEFTGGDLWMPEGHVRGRLEAVQ